MVQTPGKVVPAVRIDSLEHTDCDPRVHGQDVEILCNGAIQNRRSDGSETKGHDFDGGRVLGGETEGCGVLVVDLVDVLVQRAPVHGAVSPVMPCVLEYEEDGYLVGHLPHAGKGNGRAKAEVLAHGVEEPDLREFDGEVGEENEEGALPLFVGSRDFLLWYRLVSCCIGGDKKSQRVWRHIPAESCTS
jgi:hypothetical protein